MSGINPYREQYKDESAEGPVSDKRVVQDPHYREKMLEIVLGSETVVTVLQEHLETRRPFNDPAFENGYRSAVNRCIELARERR
jgi:hypothetical protein